jgi:hypothetical protein
VNWFLKSTRPQAVEGRRVVNDLYSRFPDTNGMLRRRLRSRNNLDLRTALDELFVHEQLSRRYRVEYEPVTASGGSPDFKLYDGPDHAATVEVVSLMDGPKWEHQRRRHGRIEDYLNRQLQPATHFIDFDIEDWDDHTNLDDLVKWVSRTLEDLRANPRALPNGPLGLPKKTYDHGSTKIDFHFWQAPDDYTPEAGDRIVTGGPAIGGWVDSALRLRRALKRKAAKYDLGGKPFAIVVGVDDWMCDLDDILNTLAGQEAVFVATGESTRKENGLYGPRTIGGLGPRRPELSAVFALQDWFPGGPYHPRFTRFDNPLAAKAFPADALPFDGHWGATQRDATHVSADWLVRPVPQMPVRTT